MTFSSSELNYLILKYLQESGLEHSAFVFGNESELNRSDLMDVDVPSGALVSIVQRGLYYIEAEVSVLNGQVNTAHKNENGTLPLIDGAAYVRGQLLGAQDPSINGDSMEISNERGILKSTTKQTSSQSAEDATRMAK
uniref:LisH n=1 Tax=Angiostrongylus cantonensis TaxID=6313 RepID=A0A0G3FFX3_ANGCA|nr:LisH [Angiostrongylus cantonensis]